MKHNTPMTDAELCAELATDLRRKLHKAGEQLRDLENEMYPVRKEFERLELAIAELSEAISYDSDRLALLRRGIVA